MVHDSNKNRSKTKLISARKYHFLRTTLILTPFSEKGQLAISNCEKMGNCCFGFDASDGHFFTGWGIFGTLSTASKISGLKIYNNKISASYTPHAYFYNLYN